MSVLIHEEYSTFVQCQSQSFEEVGAIDSRRNRDQQRRRAAGRHTGTHIPIGCRELLRLLVLPLVRGRVRVGPRLLRRRDHSLRARTVPPEAVLRQQSEISLHAAERRAVRRVAISCRVLRVKKIELYLKFKLLIMNQNLVLYIENLCHVTE